MKFPENTWKWSGGIALTGAVLMLVLGMSVLKERLSAIDFLLWWFGCFLLTIAAMFSAFLEMRRIRALSRDQQRKLVENTLDSIQHDKDLRKPGTKGNESN